MDTSWILKLLSHRGSSWSPRFQFFWPHAQEPDSFLQWGLPDHLSWDNPPPGVPAVVQQLTNPTSIHEDAGGSLASLRGLGSWCCAGCRCGLDPELLWLWRRLEAMALIGPLAWEPPYAKGLALKRKRKKGQKKDKFSPCLSWVLPSFALGYRFWFSGLQSRIGTYTLGPTILRPLNLDWITSSAFLVLQLAASRAWDFSTFITIWAKSCNKSISICLYLELLIYIDIYQYLYGIIDSSGIC